MKTLSAKHLALGKFLESTDFSQARANRIILMSIFYTRNNENVFPKPDTRV
jgi:hypothetical protein